MAPRFNPGEIVSCMDRRNCIHYIKRVEGKESDSVYVVSSFSLGPYTEEFIYVLDLDDVAVKLNDLEILVYNLIT